MDAILEGMLKAYIDAFDSFACDNPQINAEVDKFKKELANFANSVNDVAEFMDGYELEGYSKRYIDLFGKIALAQANDLTAQANDLTVEEIKERQQITPIQFVDQYKHAYESIKVNKYRVKAIKAYQNLFELAENSKNMLDFNIESERGNLLFKLSAADAIEQIEFLMEASDPLDKIAYPGHERRVRDWEKAVSDADITFSSDMVSAEVVRNSNIETQRMNVIFALTLLVAEYISFKNGVLATLKDKDMGRALSGMMHRREQIRYLIDKIMPIFGINIETIFDDKYYRMLLLIPKNLDATGRVKQCCHPQNIEAIKEIVREDILIDKPIVELVFRSADTPFYFEIDRQKKDIALNYERKAKELNAKLSYYNLK